MQRPDVDRARGPSTPPAGSFPPWSLRRFPGVPDEAFPRGSQESPPRQLDDMPAVQIVWAFDLLRQLRRSDPEPYHFAACAAPWVFQSLRDLERLGLVRLAKDAAGVRVYRVVRTGRGPEVSRG